VVRAFEDAGLSPPRVIMRTPSLPLRDILVSSTDCLGYSSTRVARNAIPRIRFAEFRVKELAWTRRVAVAYRSDAYLSPIARRFIEILKTTTQEIAKKP
jgi:DNA-binding transcriptional LysR family regulator